MSDIAVLEVDGVKVNIRAESGDRYVVEEVMEKDSYGLRELRRRGWNVGVAVDVGGHIGTFGLMVKHLWPEARLMAFEPFESSAALYEASIRDNGMADVQVCRKAVAYGMDRKCLLCPGGHLGGLKLTTTGHASEVVAEQKRCDAWDDGTAFIPASAVPIQDGPTAVKHEVVSDYVESVRLEDVVPEGRAVDLLKLDCEGSEYDIVEGMSDGLASRVLMIVGERHGDVARLKALCERKFPHLAYWDAGRWMIDAFGMVPR
jgi:FkbM family methyltransferase